MPAYAFTIHKVQGLTLDCPVVIDCKGMWDCEHLVYVAVTRNGMSIMLDETAGPFYDVILLRRGGKIMFDTPARFHYLAAKENAIKLVEEQVR